MRACMYMCVYQPLHTRKMWHKVSFYARFNEFEFRIFFSWLVAVPSLRAQSSLLFSHSCRENDLIQGGIVICYFQKVWSRNWTRVLVSISHENNLCTTSTNIRLVRWLFGFYGISTFVTYLTPNPLFCKLSVLLQTIQFSMSTQFNCQNIPISSYSVYSNSSN